MLLSHDGRVGGAFRVQLCGTRIRAQRTLGDKEDSGAQPSNAMEGLGATFGETLEIDVDIADIKSRLGYPSTDKNDLIHATFDQLFFGPELYSKIFQKKSNFSEYEINRIHAEIPDPSN